MQNSNLAPILCSLSMLTSNICCRATHSCCQAQLRAMQASLVIARAVFDTLCFFDHCTSLCLLVSFCQAGSYPKLQRGLSAARLNLLPLRGDFTPELISCLWPYEHGLPRPRWAAGSMLYLLLVGVTLCFGLRQELASTPS